MHKQNEYDLEQIIDQEGLADVLLAIAGICFGKAEHLRTNWQDHTMAKRWDSDGNKIHNLVAKLKN